MFVSRYTVSSICLTYIPFVTITTRNFIVALVFKFDFAFTVKSSLRCDDEELFLFYLKHHESIELVTGISSISLSSLLPLLESCFHTLFSRTNDMLFLKINTYKDSIPFIFGSLFFVLPFLLM